MSKTKQLNLQFLERLMMDPDQDVRFNRTGLRFEGDSILIMGRVQDRLGSSNDFYIFVNQRQYDRLCRVSDRYLDKPVGEKR